ncbi:MAG: cytochrome c oxidase subunit II [Gemmatimonadaceae bacterium]
MTSHSRTRRLAIAALTAVTVAGLAACSTVVPNTTLQPRTEFGRAIDALWDTLLFWGTIVFILVEALLIYTILRYRRREGQAAPKHVHGNTTLEIAWTLAPAVILALIAVPTVKTIFVTQANAPRGSMTVEVIGHQWWWEFRYPEYGVTTANELYLPVGRTVNFALTTQDVLHSFWIPQLGGKRDLITNRTNYLWFTPESAYVWNGVCVEYCGTSHANMRFKTFVVPPDQFEAWVNHQRGGPVFGAAPAPATGAQPGQGTAPATQTTPPAPQASAPPVQPQTAGSLPTFPADRLPLYAASYNPVPSDLTIGNVTGDAGRGAQLFRTSPCIACHVVQGVSAGIVGPTLTHFGSRTSLGAGLFPNDARHVALWIKDSPAMKPGSRMPAFGKSATMPAGYDDQQIADLAAYLLSLK